MKVRKAGNNMTELSLTNGTDVLFSYETPVAAFIEGEGYVRTATKYSVTTSRHINKWLNGMVAREVDQSVIDALTDA